MTRFLFIPIILLLAVNSMAQDSIPYLTGNDLGTNRVMTFKRFSDADISSYMGDAANIYREYGMKEMLLQEILYQKVLIRVEYYMMNDNAAAFGAFSVSKQKCTRSSIITRFDCINMQRVQFVLGKLYVNITANLSSPESGVICETLGKIIARKLVFKDWEYPRFFATPLFYNYISNVKLIRGTEAFKNAYPDWIEKFKGLNFETVMLPVDFNGGSCALGMISFRTLMEMDRFIKSNGLETTGSNGAYKKIVGKTEQFLMISGPKDVLYMESWGNSKEVEDFSFNVEQWIRNILKSGKQK